MKKKNVCENEDRNFFYYISNRKVKNLKKKGRIDMTKLKVNKSTKRWLVDGDCSKCERNVFGNCFRPCLMSDHHGLGDVRMVINERLRISLGAYRTNMPYSSCSKNDRKED